VSVTEKKKKMEWGKGDQRSSSSGGQEKPVKNGLSRSRSKREGEARGPPVVPTKISPFGATLEKGGGAFKEKVSATRAREGAGKPANQ